jgi:plasmid stability protein
MATLTIRNLPDDVVERVKATAARHGRSMEQELRLLIEARYRDREEILRRIEEHWARAPRASAEEIDRWIDHDRA